MNDDVLEAFSALTETQRTRLAAHLAGRSNKAIARSEGVTPQSVSETLAAPAVRQLYFKVAGHRLRARAGSIEELISELLVGLQEAALRAEKPVVFGNNLRMVPDHRMRVEATVRLLSMIEPPDACEKQQRVDEVVARETHTREIRHRAAR